MVAPSKALFFALLAVSAQAIGPHHGGSHHGRALNGYHAHHAAHHAVREMAHAETDAIRKRMASSMPQVVKRQEENKNRLKKRAPRCKPKKKITPVGTGSAGSDPSKDDNKKNTKVTDKGNANDNGSNDNGKKDDNKDNNKDNGGNNSGNNKDNGGNKDNSGNKGNSGNDNPPPPKNTGGNTLVGQTFTDGDGTFYSTGLDACGFTDHDTDFIAAVSHEMFDTFPGATANPNKNPICNKRVRASFGGKSIVVRVVDKCMGCWKKAALDFSPAAFKALYGNMDLGRVSGLSYTFLD